MNFNKKTQTQEHIKQSIKVNYLLKTTQWVTNLASLVLGVLTSLRSLRLIERSSCYLFKFNFYLMIILKYKKGISSASNQTQSN